MIKSELIEQLSNKFTHLSRLSIERVVNTALKIIGTELAKGDKVQLMGFGTFEVREHAGRTVKNPRTGENIDLPTNNRVHFKPGTELKRQVKH